jgi:Domain of unknown function (DUF4145)
MSYYHPLISRKRPQWFEALPVNLNGVLNEVYVALQSDSYYLATFGARTVLDLLIVEKIGDAGAFEQKIRRLKADGHITEEERDLVETVIEAGNASANRGFAPNQRDLKHVMDIVEVLLDKFYIAKGRQKQLAANAAALKKKIPPRPKR